VLAALITVTSVNFISEWRSNTLLHFNPAWIPFAAFIILNVSYLVGWRELRNEDLESIEQKNYLHRINPGHFHISHNRNYCNDRQCNKNKQRILHHKQLGSQFSHGGGDKVSYQNELSYLQKGDRFAIITDISDDVVTLEENGIKFTRGRWLIEGKLLKPRGIVAHFINK